MSLFKRPHRSKILAISILVLLAISLLLNACNYPGLRQETEAPADLIYTSAAETVNAQLTEANQPVATTETSPTGDATTAVIPPTATVTPPFVTTAPPTATTRPPTATSTPICDLVRFVDDITIPDNTEVQPGATFVKTWRLRNAGTCTWNSSYNLVYEGDNVFNAPPGVPISTGNVPPGATVDVSVTLTAPIAAGTYRQNFKLANPAGQRFGLGDGSKPFWVQVEVVVPSGIVYDFITQATTAVWKSGTGSTFDTPLTFGGADDDANGVAKIKEGVKLETGANSGKILLTFPKHVANGVISGTYPPYLVQKGDRLRARLGFMANPDGTCGAGKVTFQLLYQEGAVFNSMGQWNKTCDGQLLPIQIDLSPLAGRTIQIIFVAKAGADFQDDWAIWNSPLIER